MMFRECGRPCIGGRMFWQPAEPAWRKDLGYVGMCSHCGFQAFTADLLYVAPNQELYVGKRRRLSAPQWNKRKMEAA